MLCLWSTGWFSFPCGSSARHISFNLLGISSHASWLYDGMLLIRNQRCSAAGCKKPSSKRFGSRNIPHTSVAALLKSLSRCQRQFKGCQSLDMDKWLMGRFDWSLLLSGMCSHQSCQSFFHPKIWSVLGYERIMKHWQLFAVNALWNDLVITRNSTLTAKIS